MGCGASSPSPAAQGPPPQRVSKPAQSMDHKKEDSDPHPKIVAFSPAPSDSEDSDKPVSRPKPVKSSASSKSLGSMTSSGCSRFESRKKLSADDSEMGRMSSAKMEMMRSQSSSMAGSGKRLLDGSSGGEFVLRRAKSETFNRSFRFIDKYVTAHAGHGRKHHQAVSAEMESEMRKRINEHAKGSPISHEEAEFLMARLQNHFLFKFLSEASLKMLCERMEKRSVQTGEFLVKQGDEASEMYVVMEGGFDVYVKKEGADAPLKVAHCGGGACLGEMALMYDTKRTASLVANEHSGGECVVFALPRPIYQLTLMGKAETPSRMRSSLGSEQSSEFKAIDRAAWLLEALPESQVGELLTRMRRSSVYGLFRQRQIGAVLVIVETGSVQLVANASPATQKRRTMRGELCAEGNLEPGDVLVVCSPGMEGILAAMYESYESKLVNRDSMAKLRLLGGSNHNFTLTDNAVASELLYVPLSEFFPLLSFPDGLLANRACVRGLVRASHWFDKFPTNELEALAFGFKAVRLSAGTALVELDAEVVCMFLIVQGKFKITKELRERELVVCHAEAGDVVGEYACATGEPAEVNAIAMEEAIVLQLDREVLKSSPFGMAKASAGIANRPLSKPRLGDEKMTLEDLRCIAVIGVGAFARVALVRGRKDKTFVLKKMERSFLQAKQVYKQVLNERSVMGCLDHPNICKLYATYKTKLSIMMMLEPCMGGELYSYMRNKDILEPNACRFYAACVISALEYMHARHIIYRDLKPENIVLTAEGYAKLVDFGFAKRISKRAYTLCGTPEYLAPEQIQVSGHDYAADWWAVGVLIYEMAMGAVPFCFVNGKPEYDMNPRDLYANILDENFSFYLPASLDESIIRLVLDLLTPDPLSRLGRLTGGAQDVKDAAFFTNVQFDWDALFRRQILPPYSPPISSNEDLQNFEGVSSDDDFLREPRYDFPSTEWDYDF